MRKFLGWLALLAGAWMLISPQALMGLKQLQWMHRYAFSGEAVLAIPVMGIAYYLLDFKPASRS